MRNQECNNMKSSSSSIVTAGPATIEIVTESNRATIARGTVSIMVVQSPAAKKP